MTIRPGRGERGFTLIEVMASLVVFSIVTLGIVPLLLSAVRGAGMSRGYTVGKNVAVKVMERARGFPFFIDYPTQRGYRNNTPPFHKVDVLDLYYPQYSSSGTFVTTCSASNAPNPACPRTLPAGYSVEYRARFVTPRAAGMRETYETVVPPTTYRWNPDPYNGQDAPVSPMIELTAIVAWTHGGEAKSVDLTGIIGEREYGDVTVRAGAKVDYGIQVRTPFVDEEALELTGAAGFAESRIETKTSSTADQTVRAAHMELSTVPTDPADTAVEVAAIDGATSVLHAPPDSAPLGASQGVLSLLHPRLGSVGGADATTTEDLEASVSRDLPRAEGGFRFAGTETARLFWSAVQLGEDNDLRIEPSRGALYFRPRGQTLSGGSSATTTAVSSPSRAVNASAGVEFGRLSLFRTDFINGSILDETGSLATARAVIVIEHFRAQVACNSTRNPSTAYAEKSWQARLHFWQDADPRDGIPSGAYRSIPVSSSAATDPLTAFGPANNPVVYDDPGGGDLYLFDDPGSGRRGYLRSWSSAVGTATTEDAQGIVTQASLDGVIRIETASVDPERTDTALSLQVGNVSCEAVDRR